MTLNNLMLRLQSWCFGEYGVSLHYHCSDLLWPGEVTPDSVLSMVALSAGAVEYADCRGVTPHNETTCWPWVATRNAWERDPGGWAVHDLAAKEATRLASLPFGPAWARQAVGEARSNQSSGHVSPLSDLKKSELEGKGCRVSHCLIKLNGLK